MRQHGWAFLFVLGVLICGISPAAFADPDLYEILQINADASPEEIRKAFHKRALLIHPDHHPEDPEAPAKFMVTMQAYEILSEPELRAFYDVMGIDGVRALRDGHLFESEDPHTQTRIKIWTSPGTIQDLTEAFVTIESLMRWQFKLLSWATLTTLPVGLIYASSSSKGLMEKAGIVAVIYVSGIGSTMISQMIFKNSSKKYPRPFAILSAAAGVSALAVVKMSCAHVFAALSI